MSIPCARIFDTGVLAFALSAVILVPACSGSTIPSGDDADSGELGTGGTGTGGSSFAGGPSTGGSSAAGGSRATGGSKATGGMHATGGAQNTGGTSAAKPPTWAELYANYFGTGTPGNCVSSGCHGGAVSPSFNSASSMCSAMKSRGIIGSGTANFESLLKWFNKGGQMPMNNNPTPANAVADITAWEKAGAACP